MEHRHFIVGFDYAVRISGAEVGPIVIIGKTGEDVQESLRWFGRRLPEGLQVMGIDVLPRVRQYAMGQIRKVPYAPVFRRPPIEDAFDLLLEVAGMPGHTPILPFFGPYRKRRRC